MYHQAVYIIFAVNAKQPPPHPRHGPLPKIKSGTYTYLQFPGEIAWKS